MNTKIFGRKWQVIDSLTEGGQSYLYRVKMVYPPAVVNSDKDRCDKEYILKRLKNETRIDRFKREIDALGKVDSKYIAKIIDYGTDPNPYYVTEKYGKPLSEFLQDMKGDFLRIIKIVRKICIGLKSVHNNKPKIIHRDLKPDNILIDEKDNPVIIDFGLCFIEDKTRITFSSEQVGSRYYIPPECEEGRVNIVSESTDIYSLGKILYAMTSGGKIFARENYRRDDNNLEFILSNRRGEYINRVLDKCIKENPVERFQNIGEVMKELDKYERLIEDRYYPIEREKDLCKYCGESPYTLLGEFFRVSVMRKEGTTFISGQGQDKIELWRCPSCSNIQLFVPKEKKK